MSTKETHCPIEDNHDGDLIELLISCFESCFPILVYGDHNNVLESQAVYLQEELIRVDGCYSKQKSSQVKKAKHRYENELFAGQFFLG